LNARPIRPVVLIERVAVDTLDRAISELRRDAHRGPGLSGPGRSRIAAACWEDLRESPESYRPIFRPRYWLSAAAIAPVLVAVVVAVGVPTADRQDAMFVGASKTGDLVVFDVADGPGPHVVLKSTDPRRFNPAAATVVEDKHYADLAQSGPVIVYYRID
jgi:hypothetical protein